MKNELCETEKIRNLAAALKDALYIRDKHRKAGPQDFSVKSSADSIAVSLWRTAIHYENNLMRCEDDEADAPDEKASDEMKLTALGDGGEAAYYDLLVDEMEGKGGKWLE